MSAILWLEEVPRDGGVDGGLRDLESEQAQPFATPLTIAAHPLRAWPCQARLSDVPDLDHGTNVAPFR